MRPLVNRRKFLALLGGAATMPLTARAQQAIPVIGVIAPAIREMFAPNFDQFLRGLGESGLVEGHDFSIEYRSAGGRNDLLPAIAAELVRRPTSVIYSSGDAQTLAVKATATTIPIVFLGGDDPVRLGFVASLNKPGSNITGITTLGVSLGPKRLELLHEIAPHATVIGHFVNPANPTSTEAQSTDLEDAVRALGLELHRLHVSSDRDVEAAFSELVKLRADALVIGVDGFLLSRTQQLAALALQHKLPAVFQNREFAAAGGLMSYGGDTLDAQHLAGIYTGRILKGEKPADLPVQQATRVELIINMKTAKALGLTMPISLLGRADEVLE